MGKQISVVCHGDYGSHSAHGDLTKNRVLTIDDSYFTAALFRLAKPDDEALFRKAGLPLIPAEPSAEDLSATSDQSEPSEAPAPAEAVANIGLGTGPWLSREEKIKQTMRDMILHKRNLTARNGPELPALKEKSGYSDITSAERTALLKTL